MAEFNINSTVTTTRNLTGNEDGILGPNGSIQVLTGNAINETGGISHDLFLYGSVLATSSSAIFLTDVSANIFIGATGQVASIADALNITTTTQSFNLVNAGLISSEDDSLQLAGGDGSAFIVNSGIMACSSDALLINGNAGHVFELQNSGEISGGDSAIDINSAGTARIVNTGVIISDTLALDVSSAVVTLINSGDIIGRVDLGSGDDFIDNRNGVITGDINGEAGNDVLRCGMGAETINGGLGDDIIHGRDGDDVISGGGGFERMFGNAGDDMITGAGKNDTINGGLGDDTLTGGGGRDEFVFFRRAGIDVITDYTDGLDLINLEAFNIFSFQALKNSGALSNENNAVRIDLDVIGGEGTVIVEGVLVGNLDASNFIF